jgi:hypothetical protein
VVPHASPWRWFWGGPRRRGVAPRPGSTVRPDVSSRSSRGRGKRGSFSRRVLYMPSGGRARASATVTCDGRIYRSVVGFRTMSVARRSHERKHASPRPRRPAAPSSLLLPASSPRHSRVQREADAAAGVSVREWLQHVLVSTQHYS